MIQSDRLIDYNTSLNFELKLFISEVSVATFLSSHDGPNVLSRDQKRTNHTMRKCHNPTGGTIADNAAIFFFFFFFIVFLPFLQEQPYLLGEVSVYLGL